MGDFSRFQNAMQFYAFYAMLFLCVFSEIFIAVYTHQKSTDPVRHLDKGTKWLLILNYIVCIYAPFWFTSQKAPEIIKNAMLLPWVSYPGIFMILVGIVVRLTAVLTLKRAFTLNVQTTQCQHLITAGIYKKIRNPAYTGSILSLTGIALSLRNVFSVLITVFLCVIVYSLRIYFEETALKERFGKEFADYKKNTYKIFPYIW